MRPVPRLICAYGELGELQRVVIREAFGAASGFKTVPLGR